MGKGKGGFYEVFNWRTGKVVSSFDKEWEAREEAERLGDDYDYGVQEDD